MLVMMLFSWNNKIYKIEYYLCVLSVKWLEKYQSQGGLLSRLVLWQRTLVQKREEPTLNITAVPKEVLILPP